MSCLAFSLALDECTGIRDTTQRVMYIRLFSAGLDVDEELQEMASLSSKTIGQDNCEHMNIVVQMFELNPAKVCGLITDGAPCITGRTNGIRISSYWRYGTRYSCMSMHYSPRERVY